jgi:hypothetical protein
MFVNVSNHPVAKWSPEQIAAAVHLAGDIVDLPFPNVPPMASTADVTALAKGIVAKLSDNDPGVAMVQGEASLCFELSRMLLVLGWQVVVACSERNAVDGPDGKKIVTFEFAQFRALRN